MTKPKSNPRGKTKINTLMYERLKGNLEAFIDSMCALRAEFIETYEENLGKPDWYPDKKRDYHEKIEETQKSLDGIFNAMEQNVDYQDVEKMLYDAEFQYGKNKDIFSADLTDVEPFLLYFRFSTLHNLFNEYENRQVTALRKKLFDDKSAEELRKMAEGKK